MAKNRNKPEGLTKDEKILVVLVTIILLSIGFVLGAILFNQEEKKTACYDMQSFNDTLSDIQDKCGTTHIVKKYGNNEDWFIFNSQGCKVGDYECFYKKLEDCLK